MLTVLLVMSSVAVSFAQTQELQCSYRNLDTKESITGRCTRGPEGVAIDVPVITTIEGKPAVPGSMGLKRISIVTKEREGNWSLVEIDGKLGMQFSKEPCNISYATHALRQSIDVNCTGRTVDPMADFPLFMTAGGAWVGKWYTGRASLCKGRPGETEGLLSYSTSKVDGMETSCDVTKITRRGKGVNLALACAGEGTEWRDNEYLEVVQGKLKRTVLIERKKKTFSYDRCP